MQNDMKKKILFFLILFSSSFNLFAQLLDKGDVSQAVIDSLYEMVMKSPNLLQDFVYDTILYNKCLYAINQEEARFKNQLQQMKQQEDSMLDVVYDKVLCRLFLDEKEIEISNDFEVSFFVDLQGIPHRIKSQITNNSFSYPIYYNDSSPVLFVFKCGDIFLYSLEKDGIRQNNNVFEYVVKIETKDKNYTKIDLDGRKQLFVFSIAYNRPCSNCSCVNIHYSFKKSEYDTNSNYLKKRHLKKKQATTILHYLDNQ